MLDIKRIRQNPDEVKAALSRRDEAYCNSIDEILEIDTKRRKLSTETDNLKAEQNRASKEVPAKKKNGEDVTALMEELKNLSEKIKVNDAELAILEEEQRTLLLGVPNAPDASIPIGKDDTENEEIRRWGEPRTFDFEFKPHWDLGAELGILDPERAAKVTGSRFHFILGDGAKLDRALMNFYLDVHARQGYTEVEPPYMVSRDSMTGTGQLPKFEDDAYKLTDPDYFLISTAEVPLTNYYREEIIDGKQLPISFCAYSACFRKEAGSAGRDTRGLVRQHQFQKVEMVKFSKPEDSYKELEKMTGNAEELLQLLGIPYRVVCLCTGDLGFSSQKTYDIEVWMPSYNRYVEISSCSNMGDYQARRAGIRYKDSLTDQAQYAHTLNGSGLPIGRSLAAILENYQNEDGTVTVPEVLRSYFGKDLIKPCEN